MELLLRIVRLSIRPNFSVHPVEKTMHWIKKWMHLFDGHNELYHHAKFGEDRTMIAGCRCENVVFVFVFTGRIAAVLFLLTGQKSGFSPCRGDSLHRFRSNFAGLTGTWVRLAVQNFTSISADGWECGPCRCENVVFVFFVCLSRSESGAPCIRGVHSSNTHCVAIYRPISTRFAAFFRKGLPFQTRYIVLTFVARWRHNFH